MASRRPIINWIKDFPGLKGYVKDQKDRINCWALATAWDVGARHAIKRRIGVKKGWLLSAQYLMDDFIRDRPNEVPKGNNGRMARDKYNNYPLDTTLALDYIKQHGIPFESHYRYTGERDLGETKKDTTKFQKVFINDYSCLGSTNDGNAAKEAIYEALLLRGPLLATVDLSLSFAEHNGDQVLRPEDIESESDFNPGSDDPSSDDPLSDDPTGRNDSSSSNKSDDPSSQDSGSQDPGSHDSGSHDSGSQVSGSHKSGSQVSGSHGSGIQDNSGSHKSGQDPGSQDSGSQDAGSHKSGSHESGIQVSGSHKSGIQVSGSHKSGIQVTGSQDSGGQDSDSQDDSGSHNSGSHESGSHESGSQDASSHDSDDAGNISHAVVIFGMDYDENYYFVLNSQGLSWGIDGEGKVDCSLIVDILEPHIDDDRNRGMKGPALSALSCSPKQQRELKHLGNAMPENCFATGLDFKGCLSDVKPALLGPLDAVYEKNPFEKGSAAPKEFVEMADTASSASSSGLDSLPREDSSGKITPSLLIGLEGSDWKTCMESIEAVNKILEEANKRVQPTVELFGNQRGLLCARHQNLIMATLSTIGGTASAMGPGFRIQPSPLECWRR